MGSACYALLEKMKRCLICFVLMCGCFFSLFAKDDFFSWDFSDCEIKDILYSVSLDSGISIFADDTVSGRGDLKFVGRNFSDAFESFLTANRLFVSKNENVWVVSRFRMSVEDGLLFVDAYDMEPGLVLEKISKEMDCIVTFDELPKHKISVHFKGVDEFSLLDGLAKRFGGYEVSKGESGYHFVRKNDVRRMEVSDGHVNVDFDGVGFFVDVRNGRFSDVIEKLFALEDSFSGVDVGSGGEKAFDTVFSDGDGGKRGRNFCLLSNGDNVIQRAVFYGEDFADALEKLCFQNGFSYVLDGGLYYIFADSKSKNVLIYGERKWQKFSLKFTKSQDFLPFLMKKNGNMETMVLPDGHSFLCYASEREKEAVLELIGDIDVKIENHIVNLKYLKPMELIEHLPPDVDKSSIFAADDNSKVYFRGTESAFEDLKKQVEICDQPVKRISYDLLILQFDETKQNSWRSSVEMGMLKFGDRNGAAVSLGNVMNFNLNVVTTFGLKFALELQNSIEENKTKVFADTTLHGVSGKKISFQSTNTYRYRDNNVDPQTGKPIYSGITREISSGIKLDISGWVSGDGMITSSVVASVSRQGIDTSSSTGNPPPTSEKMVTTEVRGKSGEPIVLSGLVMESQEEQQKRIPFISKIPLLGNLFKSRERSKEKMQMVIYLVPHYENDDVCISALGNDEIYDELWSKKRMADFTKKIEGEK